MKFKGIHVMNKGSRSGSNKVAAAISLSGVLKAGHGIHGHGVYGHYECNGWLYEDKPHVIFEAEVEEGQVEDVCATGPRGQWKFFVILCRDDLPITILDVVNTD